MYPGIFGFFRHGHHGHHGHAECGPGDAQCGPGFGRGRGPGPFGHGPPGGHGGHGGPPDWDGDGGGFGVRRPLRFLAWKLELEEEQVAKLATILDDLKTERAQASVDQRRTIAAFADAVGGATFDEEKVKEAGATRVQSAERLRDAVTKALAAMHALLDDDQRKRLSYLLRSGALSI